MKKILVFQNTQDYSLKYYPSGTSEYNDDIIKIIITKYPEFTFIDEADSIPLEFCDIMFPPQFSLFYEFISDNVSGEDFMEKLKSKYHDVIGEFFGKFANESQRRMIDAAFNWESNAKWKVLHEQWLKYYESNGGK